MRFVILRKADAQTEAGAFPENADQLMSDMTAYNETLVRNGVMLAGEGLKPTSEGVRVYFDGDEATVVDGPFAEARELVAGYTMIQARSKEEAVEWARRWPTLDGDGAVELEVWQMHDDPAGPSDGTAPQFESAPPAEGARRFMSFYYLDESSRSPEPPSEEDMMAMGQFIGESMARGVTLEVGGLMPSQYAARILFSDGVPTVTDGPFTEAREMIAGYGLYQVPTLADAVEEAKAFGRLTRTGYSEIRPVYEMEDFSPHASPEVVQAAYNVFAEGSGTRSAS